MCEHAFKSVSFCHLILTDGAGSLHLYIIVELISLDLAGAWITIFIGVKVAGQLFGVSTYDVIGTGPNPVPSLGPRAMSTSP